MSPEDIKGKLEGYTNTSARLTPAEGFALLIETVALGALHIANALSSERLAKENGIKEQNKADLDALHRLRDGETLVQTMAFPSDDATQMPLVDNKPSKSEER